MRRNLFGLDPCSVGRSAGRQALLAYLPWFIAIDNKEKRESSSASGFVARLHIPMEHTAPRSEELKSWFFWGWIVFFLCVP